MINSEIDETPSILVVDDEWLNRELMHGVFSADGFRVLLSATARDALQQATQYTPDAMLVDIRMPDMDGYMICEAVKNDMATRDIVVVLITALEIDNETRQAASQAGADGLINRGMAVDEILQKVNALLRPTAT